VLFITWRASIFILICPSCPDGCSPLVYSKVQTVLFNRAADSNCIFHVFRFRIENGNRMLHRNVGNHLPDSTVSYPRRPQHESSLPCAHQISQYMPYSALDPNVIIHRRRELPFPFPSYSGEKVTSILSGIWCAFLWVH
jgi:hypothetical protein